ncbi:MAG: hypothetical protein KGH98_01050 [Candidatus Micrarchaeota archaeon]|nr:hypothetical protein [Candidatus Micrarchaeota archaeon]
MEGEIEKEFDWEVHPDLEGFVKGHVEYFLKNNSFANALSQKMMDQTSTRFVDWIDHVIIPESRANYEQFTKVGMTEVSQMDRPDGTTAFKHLRSYLFPMLMGSSENFEVALKPESIDDFLQYIGMGIKAEGAELSKIRKATVSKEGNFILSAVERRGYNGFLVSEDTDDIPDYAAALGTFYSRQRKFENDTDGVEHTLEVVRESTYKLQEARAADAFFRAERAYWQRRNWPGQVQKARQDSLGLGWGNHDHHTYRSSRANFTKMIDIFEAFGYRCREKYYAGDKAGWGAQILEHQICNIVVFTDVDLNPDETTIDFAHQGFLEKEERMGTVGLWVGLHGESVLQAGMHHLEARFEFERLTQDLARLGVEMMPPFSHFDFLKQAFTKGVVWPVDKGRLDSLLNSKYITQQQYDEFSKDGAIGSHMENLERDQGFKGFNRSSVTKIIMETDPRKQHFAGA